MPQADDPFVAFDDGGDPFAIGEHLKLLRQLRWLLRIASIPFWMGVGPSLWGVVYVLRGGLGPMVNSSVVAVVALGLVALTAALLGLAVPMLGQSIVIGRVLREGGRRHLQDLFRIQRFLWWYVAAVVGLGLLSLLVWTGRTLLALGAL